MVIFLVGFMGSGKTYWASRLSEALGLPWTDLDAEIESRESETISSIFRTKGEPYFREREARLLRSVVLHRESQNRGDHLFTQIIATGGGAPCFHQNMEWMNSMGLTVWLNPPVEEIITRLAEEKATRPLIAKLEEQELGQFVRKKLEERQEFYSLSKLEIKNTDIAVTEFVNLLIHAQKPD